MSAPGAPAAAPASLAAPGSFLTDLDVYDSLSAPPAQKPKPNGGDNTLLTLAPRAMASCERCSGSLGRARDVPTREASSVERTQSR